MFLSETTDSEKHFHHERGNPCARTPHSSVFAADEWSLQHATLLA
jgi:hypothetical protein